MKKFLFLIIILIFFLLINFLNFTDKSSAIEKATPSGKKIQEEIKNKYQEQIQEIRQRVATKVAEIKEKMRRVWVGEIKSISNDIIIINTNIGEKTILINEETKFLRIGNGGKKEISLSDLAVGEQIIVFGRLEAETEKLTAKIVLVKVLPIIINGRVLNIDIPGGTITVQTPKKGSFIVDVEKTTQILVWEKKEGLKKYGLSKIKVNDRVHINGIIINKQEKEENRITANRILVLPGKAFGILEEKLASPTATPKISPSPQPTSQK